MTHYSTNAHAALVVIGLVVAGCTDEPGVGPPGQTGPRGLTGSRGDDGEVGPAGPRGERGPAGELGPRGAPGTPGRNGSAGAAGARGATGASGAAGARGATGARGPSGPNETTSRICHEYGGRCVATLTRTTSNRGVIETLDTAGNTLARFSTLSSNSDRGWIGAYDAAQGRAVAGVNGNGTVWGTTKSFVVPHPEDPDSLIVYASLEGPKPDLYARGLVELAETSAHVEFQRHFAALVGEPETISVMLTPYGLSCVGAYIESVESTGFIIRRPNADASCRVSWMAIGARKNYQHHKTIVDRTCNEFTSPQDNENCTDQ